jgi:hypothetical protein
MRMNQLLQLANENLNVPMLKNEEIIVEDDEGSDLGSDNEGTSDNPLVVPDSDPNEDPQEYWV